METNVLTIKMEKPAWSYLGGRVTFAFWKSFCHLVSQGHGDVPPPPTHTRLQSVIPKSGHFPASTQLLPWSKLPTSYLDYCTSFLDGSLQLPYCPLRPPQQRDPVKMWAWSSSLRGAHTIWTRVAPWISSCLLAHIQPIWLPGCFSNIPGTHPPQDICTCCCFCPDVHMASSHTPWETP